MNIRFLSNNYAVAQQITPADIDDLREQGFAALVCTRPDGEEAGQPAFAAIGAQARAAGMEAFWLPVTPGRITDADRAAFAVLYANAPKPVLGFCRTGLRAETLWNDTRDRRDAAAAQQARPGD